MVISLEVDPRQFGGWRIAYGRPAFRPGRPRMNQDRESRAFHKARLKKQIQKVSGAFEYALALHQRGLIAEAQAAYRQILQQVPAHFEALHHLGITEYQAGRYEEADRILQHAVGLEPRSAAAHSNRGVVLHEMKRFEDALASFDAALAVDHKLADAWSNRGNALTKLGRCEDAVASYDKALALKPDHADALGNRGHALYELRRFDEALASCEKAIAIKPDFADALCNGGFALHELKRFDDALANFDKALAINPRLAEAWLGRGNVLLNTNHLADAMAAYNKAIEARPDYFKALIQIAACLLKQGNAAEAIAFHDKALAIKPDFGDAISNRIFSLDFIATAGFPEHQEARRQWWNEVDAGIAATSHVRHENDRDPARRIVVGDVSSDFNRHSAATAFRPVLRHHDKTKFKIIRYSCSLTDDDMTQVFRGLADVWREAAQLSDERLAAQIRADRVDILVDLSGHTSGNRLAVFARKPAPSRTSGTILSSIGMGDWVASDHDGYRAIALNHAARPDRLAALRRELPARIAASAAGDSAAYTRAVEDAYRTMWHRFIGSQQQPAVA
jgi:tetratricopeptide (TPR) repeat protein